MRETPIVHCWADRNCPTNLANPEGLTDCFGCHHPDCYYPNAFDEHGDYARGWSGTCMLLDGHEGPHEWTADESITISFAPAPPPPDRVSAAFAVIGALVGIAVLVLLFANGCVPPDIP